MSFLKDVTSFTGDLSALTCPSFMLNGVSLLEYSTYWGDHPQLLAAIAKPESPEERMIAVARWFISTLYGSYFAGCVGSTSKKPFNPILGEQFFCRWDDVDGSGDAHLVCEQVSHHPPISAFYIENPKAGVYLNGHFGQKSKFKGTSIQVIQPGRVTVRTTKNDESYVVTFPDLYIRSLLVGNPFIEVAGPTSIECSNGYVTEFEFLSKPWFGGKYHKFTGNIFHKDDPKNILYSIAGKWMAESTITNNVTKESELFFDATATPPAKYIVAPFQEQSEIESRRVWVKVAQAIQKQEYSLATTHKNEVENAQRALVKERNSKGEEWKQRMFYFVKDPVQENVNVKYKNKSKTGDVGAWVYNKSLHLQNES
ncbi:Oxysterol-binding protein [Basidiobolus meristosporus CBS 931.73]|uniref:Oxysterol-binding protein n=1 Tax=Basidiobolus meristosporus CBS 931.73 TaxID=1314790 RepID=A0A1Y1Y8X8_9FUNG|nr:Oxysterol-binding protein [Basidiobolus meristosporus CBS 931.73]|eukprot:ORX94447.1 Oxysterol-binding protein [Basidiobolus meristosporus CBS 931.73]